MFKRLAAGLLALLLCLGAAGCAGAAPGGAAPGQKDYGSGDSLNTDEGGREAAADRKLIKTVELELETRTYDAFMDSLNAGLAAAGGYVQQSDIRGGAGSAGRFRLLSLLLAQGLQLADEVADVVGAPGGEQAGERRANPGGGETQPQRGVQVGPRREAQGDGDGRRRQLCNRRSIVLFGEHFHDAFDVLHHGLHRHGQGENE